MRETVRFEVAPEESGRRIDIVLAEHVSHLSRALLAKEVSAGRVRLNCQAVKASRRVAAGDVVEGVVEPGACLTARPEAIPLAIVYRDRDLAVIDKPAGLVVHPAAGRRGGTLANGLVHLFPDASFGGGEQRPGIVHRLDKNTSGLMVVALNAAAHADLQRQLAERSMERTYIAVAKGHMDAPSGTIDIPIGRDPSNRIRMAAHGVAPRQAQTSYEVVEILTGYTLVKATLHTGRTHQIRVHFSALGHPLLGDLVYGGPRHPGLDRQFLHATDLALRSPTTGRLLVFSSPLPCDLQSALDVLRRSA
ncbi:MAG: RluA family pseudouridine synthase [Chloroflexota bacterium]|nr:MAG: RNA pseudouridine synthase [Chloroflexota bacterium]